MCCFVIDAGSCKNIVLAEAVHKLGVKIKKHPKPYKLVQQKKGGEVTLSQGALVSLSIETKYKDQVCFDMVTWMHATYC